MLRVKLLKFEPTEAEVKDAITSYLDMLKIFWWRQNNGMAVYQDKNKGERRVKYGTEGASDLGCIAGGDLSSGVRGKYVAIEIKTPSQYKFLIKHYDRIKAGSCNTKRDWHLFSQIGFIENVKDHGGIGFFASSIEDVGREFRANGIIIK